MVDPLEKGPYLHVSMRWKAQWALLLDLQLLLLRLLEEWRDLALDEAAAKPGHHADLHLLLYLLRWESKEVFLYSHSGSLWMADGRGELDVRELVEVLDLAGPEFMGFIHGQCGWPECLRLRRFGRLKKRFDALVLHNEVVGMLRKRWSHVVK